jgi:uncharacterized protein (TIGR03437 family)
MVPLRIVSSLLFIFGALAFAQTDVLTTIGGGGRIDLLPATKVSLGNFRDVVADPFTGALVIVSEERNQVYRVDSAGTITVLAGTGAAGFSGDQGNAVAATLRGPTFAAIDTDGTVYIADTGNNRVRAVDRSGRITTALGGGNDATSRDIPASQVRLESPRGLAFSQGALHVCEGGRIRQLYRFQGSQWMVRLVKAGVPMTYQGIAALGDTIYVAGGTDGSVWMLYGANPPARVAGTGARGYSGDGGPANKAELINVRAVAVNSLSLWISDMGANVIRRVDSFDGNIRTVAGTQIAAFSGDGGPGASARLSRPQGISANTRGELWIADSGNGRVRMLDSSGRIQTVAGSGTNATGDFGDARSATLRSPRGVLSDSAGNIYVADTGNHVVRRIDAATGVITSLPGNGSGVGGELVSPVSLAMDSKGNLYVSDAATHSISSVPLFAGSVFTVLGNGSPGFGVDKGPADRAQLSSPGGIAMGSGDRLYIADTRNHRVRVLDLKQGTIETFAGDGVCGESGDGGPATRARLCAPAAVTLDSAGILFIADANNCRVRKVDLRGDITTVAGVTSRVCGPGRTEGAAVGATVAEPYGVAVDRSGNLFIADAGTSQIRRVDAIMGQIRTVAGIAGGGAARDGIPPTAFGLNAPTGLWVLQDQSLLIADTGNDRIRRMGPCYYGFAPATISAKSDGGLFSIAFTSDSGCPVGVSTSASWLTLKTSVPGHIAITVAENLLEQSRTGVISVGNGSFLVTQAAAPPCTFTFTPPAFSLPVAARNEIRLTFATLARCTWAATTDSPWIRMANPSSGKGSGAVVFSTDAHTGDDNRAAAISVAGVVIPVTQVQATHAVRASGITTLAEPPDGRCVSPVPTTHFLSIDPATWLWMRLDGIVAGDEYFVTFSTAGLPAPIRSPISVATTGGTLCAKARLAINTGLRVGDWTASIVVRGVQRSRVNFRITPPMPVLDSDTGVSAATLDPATGLALGSIVVLRGRSLAAREEMAAAVPLPKTLAGVSVTINGISARLRYVSPARIEVQAPWSVLSDSAVVIVTSSQGKSDPLSLMLRPVAPAVAVNGGRPVVSRISGGTAAPVSPSNPVQPGDVIAVWAAGLGPVDHPPADGALGYADSTTLEHVFAQIDGCVAEVLEARLVSAGAAGDVGLFRVVLRVPEEIAVTGNVELLLKSGFYEAAAVSLPASGSALTAVSLQLKSADKMSAASNELRTLTVEGLRQNASTVVRFYNDIFSQIVVGFSLQKDTVQVPAPLYRAGGEFASGTVSLEVIQSVNGKLVRSNALDGFRIGPPPTVKLPRGQLLKEFLNAAKRDATLTRGSLSYAERATGGQNSTARLRSGQQAYSDMMDKLVAAVNAIQADPSKSLAFGTYEGVPVALDADTLALADTVLASMVLGGGSATKSSSIPITPLNTAARATAGSPYAAPEWCDSLDSPNLAWLKDMAENGYSTRQIVKAVWRDPLDRMATLDELSACIEQQTKYYDRVLKQASLVVAPAAYAGLEKANLPIDKKAKFAGRLAKLLSLPTLVNIAAQTVIGVVALRTGRTEDGSFDRITARQFAALSDGLKDWSWGFASKEYLREFRPTEEVAGEIGELLGSLGQSTTEAVKGKLDANIDVYQVFPVADPDGNNVNQSLPGSPGASTTGLALDASGKPQGGEVEWCAPAPWAKDQMPGVTAPIYPDGSYVVEVPKLDIRDPEATCRVVVRIPGQAEQSAMLSAKDVPSTINFPGDTEPRDLTLYGLGRVEADGPCGHVYQDWTVTWKVANASLSKVIAMGGTLTGRLTQKFTGTNCRGTTLVSDGRPDYVTDLGLIVTPGGMATFDSGDGWFREVKVMSDGVHMTRIKPDQCGQSYINCDGSMSFWIKR